jgi:inositol transporter-like SP family MFS transporter
MFWNLVAGLNGFFLPYIFNKVGHLDFLQSSLLNAVLWLITALSTSIFIRKGDVWNRKSLFMVGCIMQIAAWCVLVFMPKTWTSLITYDVLWGVSAGFSAQCFESLWVTELFKTDYRGAVQGFIFFVVRAGVGVVSLIFPTVMNGLGFTVAGIVLIAFLCIQAIIGGILTPETRGMTLDQIVKKQYGEEA